MIFEKRIQIFTEDVNREQTLEFINGIVEGFNYQVFKGVYKGVEEDSIKFDLWVTEQQLEDIERYIIPYLLCHNNQECIGFIMGNRQPQFLYHTEYNIQYEIIKRELKLEKFSKKNN